MPRKSKGARKHLRRRAGRPDVWVILDGTHEESTGCLADDVAGADRKLEEYLARKHRPDFRKGQPEHVAVADVLLHYVQEHAPQTAHPELIGYHMLPLGQHFGGLMCSELDTSTSRSYVKGRTEGTIGKRAVVAATARRELETLQAALNFAHEDKKLLYPIKVKYTADKSTPRERWLMRWEVAALVAAALGFVPVAYDVGTRRPAKWSRPHRPQYHVARFILIAVYTGTRHDAVLKLRWGQNVKGGWFDLDRELLYRRGQGQAETNKRRTPAPIPEDLLPHVRRWRRLTLHGPVEYQGKLIGKQKTGFKNARDRAGLGNDVVPHVLRHTCATWNLQSGVSTWVVAGMLGTSEKVIRDTYGHHAPEYLSAAKKRFRGRNLGK